MTDTTPKKAAKAATTRPFEEWASEAPAWHLAAIKARMGWPARREVTQQEFLDAHALTLTGRIGGAPNGD